MFSLGGGSSPDSPHNLPDSDIDPDSLQRQHFGYGHQDEEAADGEAIRSSVNTGFRRASKGQGQGNAASPGKNAPPMRAALYLRQSVARDGDELAIDRQKAECLKLAKQRGYKVVETLVDNNVSATTGKRPAYERLLTLIEGREIDVVVVLRHDRLLRRLTELEHLIELSERTGVLIATVQGELQLDTSTGRLLGRILASVARAEVETKSERHRLANRQRAEQGLPHLCRRPYGYEQGGIEIKPDEAEVLRHWAKMLQSGYGFKHCAWWANENGHKTTRGAQFYPVTVRNMITAKRYAGIRHYEGVDYPAVWEPIFQPDEWEALQAIVRYRKEQRAGVVKSRKYLLTGIAYCGGCGLHLNGSTTKDKDPNKGRRPIYICKVQGDVMKKRGCGRISRNATAIEEWIRQCIVYRLDSPQLTGLLNESPGAGDSIRKLLDERTVLESRKNALVDDYADGTLDKASFARANGRVEASLKRVQTELDHLSLQRVQIDYGAAESVSDAWENNGPEWKRSLVELLIEKIVIHPGVTKPRFPMPDGTMAYFDPSLVEIEWKA